MYGIKHALALVMASMERIISKHLLHCHPEKTALDILGCEPSRDWTAVVWAHLHTFDTEISKVVKLAK